MDWRTWAPFQSKKMREVCEHLTAKEMREVARRAAGWGRTVGWSFAGYAALLFTYQVWPKWAPQIGLSYDSVPQIPLWLDISLIVILVVIWLPAGMRFRKRQKEFLASTEWAKMQGYTVDDL